MQKSVHSSDYRAVRDELKLLRKAAGLSQRDLAAELGVAHSWIAKVESGERRIDLVEFIWFAKACGFEPISAIKRILRATNAPKGGGKK